MAIHYFGKKQARPGAIRFLLDKYVDTRSLPIPPISFGHAGNNWPWGILGNDSCGCCVWSGFAHETMLLANATRRPWPNFTDQSVIEVYCNQTGYVPGVPSTDDGTDMQQAAEYRRLKGLPDRDGVRHFIKAYAAIPITNDQAMLDLIMKLTYAFGCVGAGFRMQQAASEQFDARQPMSLVRGSPIIGGHYMPIVGRNSRGNALALTWGRITAITPAYMIEQIDEIIVYLSREYISVQTNLTPELLDEHTLDTDLALLTSAKKET